MYLWEERLAEADRARRVIEFLWEYFLAHPEEVAASEYTRPDDPLARRIADYIAGMTDQFAMPGGGAAGVRELAEAQANGEGTRSACPLRRNRVGCGALVRHRCLARALALFDDDLVHALAGHLEVLGQPDWLPLARQSRSSK